MLSDLLTCHKCACTDWQLCFILLCRAYSFSAVSRHDKSVFGLIQKVTNVGTVVRRLNDVDLPHWLNADQTGDNIVTDRRKMLRVSRSQAARFLADKLHYQMFGFIDARRHYVFASCLVVAQSARRSSVSVQLVGLQFVGRLDDLP